MSEAVVRGHTTESMECLHTGGTIRSTSIIREEDWKPVEKQSHAFCFVTELLKVMRDAIECGQDFEFDWQAGNVDGEPVVKPDGRKCATIRYDGSITFTFAFKATPSGGALPKWAQPKRKEAPHA